jgi:hypothetical protein
MKKPTEINPNHKEIRSVLRVVGPCLLVVGGLFMLVGMISFLRRSVASIRPDIFGAALLAAHCCFLDSSLPIWDSWARCLVMRRVNQRRLPKTHSITWHS